MVISVPPGVPGQNYTITSSYLLSRNICYLEGIEFKRWAELKKRIFHFSAEKTWSCGREREAERNINYLLRAVGVKVSTWKLGYKDAYLAKKNVKMNIGEENDVKKKIWKTELSEEDCNSLQIV